MSDVRNRLPRPRTALLTVLVVLLGGYDALTITPGWPYAVVFGVPVLAGASLVQLAGHRTPDPDGGSRDRAPGPGWALAGAAVLLSGTGTVLLALRGYRYLGTWGMAETAALLLLVVLRWRRAAGAADHALIGAVALAVIAQSVRGGRTDAPVYAALLAAAVTAAAAIGVALRGADAQQRMVVTAVRRAEREEVARELHDVVAHHVTGMVVATQAARAVLGSAPAQVPGPVVEALAGIETAGTEALSAMRRMVGVLRTDPASGAHRLPTPQLSDLTALVARFRATGTAGEVELAVDVAGAGLPAEVQAGIYRVVQESLTNIARHACGAALVQVDVAGDTTRVDVRVLNTRGRPGPVASPAGGGFGVLGMSERVTALGGTLTAGPRDGGWVVHAAVPVHRTRSAG